MRNLNTLDAWRDISETVVKFYGNIGDDTCGVFTIPSPIDNAPLKVIAAVGEGWDHVSVSRANRCPNWVEMSVVKDMFFKDTETAMQLHVPRSDHINFHPHCLHIWAPHPPLMIPLPPKEMVA